MAFIICILFSRLTVKELLESEFFLAEKLRVELAKSVQEILEENLTTIPLRLKGERANHSQDEAIEFDYTLNEDKPEHVASEMVRFNLVYCRDVSLSAMSSDDFVSIMQSVIKNLKC